MVACDTSWARLWLVATKGGSINDEYGDRAQNESCCDLVLSAGMIGIGMMACMWMWLGRCVFLLLLLWLCIVAWLDMCDLRGLGVEVLGI